MDDGINQAPRSLLFIRLTKPVSCAGNSNKRITATTLLEVNQETEKKTSACRLQYVMGLKTKRKNAPDTKGTLYQKFLGQHPYRSFFGRKGINQMTQKEKGMA